MASVYGEWMNMDDWMNELMKCWGLCFNWRSDNGWNGAHLQGWHQYPFPSLTVSSNMICTYRIHHGLSLSALEAHWHCSYQPKINNKSTLHKSSLSLPQPIHVTRKLYCMIQYYLHKMAPVSALTALLLSNPRATISNFTGTQIDTIWPNYICILYQIDSQTLVENVYLELISIIVVPVFFHSCEPLG